MVDGLNDKAVCRSAPATPGLLNIIAYYDTFLGGHCTAIVPNELLVIYIYIYFFKYSWYTSALL